MNKYNECKFVSTFFGEMHPKLELIVYTAIKEISTKATMDEYCDICKYERVIER